MTARLSKLFYERLGEQATNELVDWFNAVDATYKAELREFNELNFARFDAKLEQRIALVEHRIGKVEARLGNVEDRLGKVEDRLGKVEDRLGRLEQRFDSLQAQLEHRIDQAKYELIKWMFVFWTGAVLAGRLLR